MSRNGNEILNDGELESCLGQERMSCQRTPQGLAESSLKEAVVEAWNGENSRSQPPSSSLIPPLELNRAKCELVQNALKPKHRSRSRNRWPDEIDQGWHHAFRVNDQSHA